MRAKVYCEVTCGRCGNLSMGSAYYKNASTILKLKECSKNWIWDKDFGGNICPSCQEEIKKK